MEWEQVLEGMPEAEEVRMRFALARLELQDLLSSQRSTEKHLHWGQAPKRSRKAVIRFVSEEWRICLLNQEPLSVSLRLGMPVERTEEELHCSWVLPRISSLD